MPNAWFWRLGYGIFNSNAAESSSGRAEAGNWTSTGKLSKGIHEEFSRTSMEYFSIKSLLRQYNEARAHINRKFILVATSNENWGLLSGVFPGRTARWGRCCEKYKLLPTLLADDNVIMIVINQRK